MKIKFIVAAAALAAIYGCATGVPMAAFTPTTTSDGTQGFTLAVDESNLDTSVISKQETIERILSNHVGRAGICPNGYNITKTYNSHGHTIYEGVCK